MMYRIANKTKRKTTTPLPNTPITIGNSNKIMTKKKTKKIVNNKRSYGKTNGPHEPVTHRRDSTHDPFECYIFCGVDGSVVQTTAERETKKIKTRTLESRVWNRLKMWRLKSLDLWEISKTKITNLICYRLQNEIQVINKCEKTIKIYLQRLP